jgi:hypothetical protein
MPACGGGAFVGLNSRNSVVGNGLFALCLFCGSIFVENSKNF